MIRKLLKKVPLFVFIYRNYKSIYNKFVSDKTQAGEYTVIRKLIRKEDPRYLVDIGAHDGKSLSNSAPFIKKGWSGLLFEPMIGPYRALQNKYKDNDKIKCLNIACSDKRGSTDFFIGKDGENGMFGTLCQDKNEWMESVRSDKTIKVQVERITDVLIENKYPKNFSILMIDTEGMDYEVLLGLDFSLFTPKIIVTEEYEWNKEKHENKYNLLIKSGYEFHQLVGCNTIWIKKDFN